MPRRKKTYYLDIDGDRQEAMPAMPENTSLKKTREEGERYYLTEISNAVDFVRFDYDRINAAAFNALFTLKS